MNTVTMLCSRFVKVMGRGVLLLMLAYSVTASAQNVLSGAQVGTVQLLRQDDGYITISDRNYNFSYDVTKVFIGGEEFDSTYINEGMVVRFTLNRDGVLERVEIIGPASAIKAATPEH